MNPLFSQMNGDTNKSTIMRMVEQLKQRMGGGDPNEYIQQMLNSGKITQDQYNQAVERAKQLRSMFN